MKQSHILSLAYLSIATDTPFCPTRLLRPKGPNTSSPWERIEVRGDFTPSPGFSSQVNIP